MRMYAESELKIKKKKKVRLNINQDYLDSFPAYELGLISCEDKNILFYYIENPFSLYAIFFDKKNNILRKKIQIWKTEEKIKPLEISRLNNFIIFTLKIKNKLKKII